MHRYENFNHTLSDCQVRDVEILSEALYLKARPRRIGSLTKWARATVTWRIRHAVRKIRAAHEPLEKHLADSLHTGTFCAYRPQRAVEWRFPEQ